MTGSVTLKKRLEQVAELVCPYYVSKLESMDRQLFMAMKHPPNLIYKAFNYHCHGESIDFSDKREVKRASQWLQGITWCVKQQHEHI